MFFLKNNLEQNRRSFFLRFYSTQKNVFFEKREKLQNLLKKKKLNQIKTKLDY